MNQRSPGYEPGGIPNFPTPLCTCRDTAISAGSHFVGASGEVLRFPSGYQEAHQRRDSNPEPTVLETVALPVELR